MYIVTSDFVHPQIDAGRPVEEVFESVKAIFTTKTEKVKARSHALRKYILWFGCIRVRC